LQIHDALYLSVAPDERQEVEEMVQSSMEKSFEVSGSGCVGRMAAENEVRWQQLLV
jgi:hypothetical protein